MLKKLYRLITFAIMILIFGIGCSSLLYHKRGVGFYENGQYKKARTELQSQLEKHPESPVLHYYLGLTYLRQHQLIKGLKHHHIANEQDSNDSMDSLYAVVIAEVAGDLNQSREFDQAKKWAAKALEFDQRNRQARYEKFMAEGLKQYFQGSKWELWDAIVAFGNAAQVFPNRALPHYYTAKSYVRKDDKDFSNAITAYRKSLELDPPESIRKEIEAELNKLSQRKKLYEDFWGN